MVNYSQSNRYLWEFWVEKIKEVKEIKGSSVALTIEGEDLFDYFEENFGEDREDFLPDMEKFIHNVIRQLYRTANQNITPFPATWNNLLNDLPFDNTRYTSFIEEYSQVKSEVIDNYQKNLGQVSRNEKKMRTGLQNQVTIIDTLLKIMGYDVKDEKVLDKEMPKELDLDEECPWLQTQIFKHLKKEVLGKRTVSRVLHQEKRKNQLLNRILGTSDLPRDWTKKLAKKADLDSETTRANNLQSWKDSHVCSPCSHSDYDTIKQERDTLKTENTQLKEHKCDCADKIKAKESEIINKIITDLSLSTDRERERESLLEAVISEIKNKMTPPNTTDQDNKIKELEAEVSKLKTPKSIKDLPISQEVKQEVIKISQELGLTKQSQARLEKATSYQELSNLQKEAFQEKINNEAKDKKSAETLNYFLGALSIGSLLVLAWVLIKRSNFTPELGNKEEK